MITDGDEWHFLTVKNSSRLLHGVTSNQNDGHYCMNCLHMFRTENKLKSHENVCRNHNYCNIKMLEAFNKMLKFNQEHKSMKIPFVIYAATESLFEKNPHMITI